MAPVSWQLSNNEFLNHAPPGTGRERGRHSSCGGTSNNQLKLSHSDSSRYFCVKCTSHESHGNVVLGVCYKLACIQTHAAFSIECMNPCCIVLACGPFTISALRCRGSKRDARKQRKALPSSVLGHVRSMYTADVHAGVGLQAAPSMEIRYFSSSRFRHWAMRKGWSLQ